MKYIIATLYFSLFLSLSLLAQNGNLVTGTGSVPNDATFYDYVTVFGDSIGVNNSFGINNSTFFGYHAGYSTTTGEGTYFGYQTGYSNTSYDDNTILGYQAGYSANAYDNTYIGYLTGYGNTASGSDGQENTWIGYKTGQYAVSKENIFIGYQVGRYATGEENIYIGDQIGSVNTLSGSYNTAIGSSLEFIEDNSYDSYYTFGYADSPPLRDATSAEANTFLGASAGHQITTGSNNTLVGFYAGFYQEEATGNTYIGFASGGETERSSGSMDENTFIGYVNGQGFREGSLITSVGHNAGSSSLISNEKYSIGLGTDSYCYNKSISVGYSASSTENYGISIGPAGRVQSSYSIGIGYNHDIYINIAAGIQNSIGIGTNVDISGSKTVGIGASVNIDNQDGIAIGEAATVKGDYSIAYGSNTSVTRENSIALGNGVSINTDNTITIGNDQVTSIRGTVNWTTLSDGRYKTDVQENVVGLDFINQLRPVSYELKSQKGIRYSGFIAQEVEVVAESIGYDFSGVKKPQNADDIYGLRYAEFVVPLTKAVQELDEQYQVNEQVILKNEEKLAQYKNAIADLKTKVEQIKQDRINNELLAKYPTK